MKVGRDVCLDHLFSWKLSYRRKISYNLYVTEVISGYEWKKKPPAIYQIFYWIHGLDNFYIWSYGKKVFFQIK